MVRRPKSDFILKQLVHRLQRGAGIDELKLCIALLSTLVASHGHAWFGIFESAPRNDWGDWSNCTEPCGSSAAGSGSQYAGWDQPVLQWLRAVTQGRFQVA